MFFGLDFGTANTSLASLTSAKNGHDNSSLVYVLELLGHGSSIPSTYFFDFDDDSQCIGQHALDKFYDGDRGRFLRSFKSALGTSTIDHEIQIKHQRHSIKKIIQNYIGQALSAAETQSERPIKHLVVGRPVHFIDDDVIADRRAQSQLQEIVSNLGVEHIEFQFEPIAAALSYGACVTKEEKVLVVDIGAGTSDFSVVKFSPNTLNQASAEVISNCGVHIGGNDFDKRIALENAMPLFGYQQRFKRRKQLELPHHYFLNASTWHKVDHLYERSIINQLKEIQAQIEQPILIQRLLDLISSRQIHKVLVASESAKVHLSEQSSAVLDFDFLERELILNVSQSQMNEQILPLCEQVLGQAKEAVLLAGVTNSQIDTVYVTGGSMGISQLFKLISEEFSHSKIIDSDRSTSVARGLALHSEHIFS